MRLRAAFTLIELLIVIAILAILMALVYLGLGDTQEIARVSRSAYVVSTALEEAKQAAAVRSLNLTIYLNSGKDPRTTGEASRNGVAVTAWQSDDRNDPEEADDVYRMADDGWTDYRRYATGNDLQGDGGNWTSGTPVNVDRSSSPPTYSQFGGRAHNTHSRRWHSPLLSRKPEDQWLAIQGPFIDRLGRWQQVRGAMPWRWQLDSQGRPYGREVSDYYEAMNRNWGNWGVEEPIVGGVFGHALDANGALPSDQRSSGGPVRVTQAVWDPYSTMIGGRRLLERGSRWIARPDTPEWDPGTYAISGYYHVMIPNTMVNRNPSFHAWNGGGRAAGVNSINMHPNGRITPNEMWPNQTHAHHTDFPFKLPMALTGGTGEDLLINAYFGIVSNKAKARSFSVSGVTWDYPRPVAMIFVSVAPTGEVIISEKPVMRR